ncbi:uncharacterized protein [Diadema antillarum]|uniref:uncharacterized protein n=1 Tax=Diadema antillarum TaxID=105358 RepID=UPI003A8B9F5F
MADDKLINPHMIQSGGLNTMMNSDDLKTELRIAMTDNDQLRAQLAACTSSMKQKMQEMEIMKHTNKQITERYIGLYKLSKASSVAQRNKIADLQSKNQELVQQLDDLRKGKSPVQPGESEKQRAVLEAVKGKITAMEDVYEQLRGGTHEARISNLLKLLLGHLKAAKELLGTCDPVQEEQTGQDIGQADEKGDDGQPKTDQQTKPKVMSPVSPTGQQAYSRSLQALLMSLKQQVDEKDRSLHREEERNAELQGQITALQRELGTLRGTQQNVAAAMEKQRQEDSKRYEQEKRELMAKLDELTLLAADKHQRHAFDEEPRYHSASNELKQQVTSLVMELEQKERYLEEEKRQNKLQTQLNESLQVKVATYHEELKKARIEAQSYIETVHLELKRKETMYLAEKQKAMHEKLQYDKCKDDMATLQSRYREIQADHSKLKDVERLYQEKEDRHLAEILSAEEAIHAKDQEKKNFEKEVTKLKGEIHIWKTQTEVCQRDFQEERRAREVMHTEKQRLLGRIDELSREKKNIEEDLQYYHRQQLQQTRYQQETPMYDRSGRTEYLPLRRPQFEAAGEDEAGGEAILAPFPREPMYPAPAPRQPQQATTDNWCPKCGETFPDFDTLTIHIGDCID